MKPTRKHIDHLTFNVIGCAIEVHKQLGPGLLESVYEKCFVRELFLKGIEYNTQTKVPIEYKGLKLDAELRLDVIVEDLLIVELKAVDGLLPIHDAILLSYMRLLQKPKGILINFNSVNIFKSGQKTLINNIYSSLPLE